MALTVAAIGAFAKAVIWKIPDPANLKSGRRLGVADVTVRSSPPGRSPGALGVRARSGLSGRMREQIVDAWEAAQSWDGKIEAVAEPVESQSPSRPRITMCDAAKIFIGRREGAQIASATLRKYQGFTRRLTAFAESRGYAMLDQITAADIDLFYGSVKLGARAKGKWLGTLRSFFRFAMNRKWLLENPVSPDIKPPIGANRLANKAPFTNEELERIVAACDRISTTEWKSGQGAGAWDGEDVKDFIWIMTYTGLRISDVALFHMDRLKNGEVLLRAQKNGGDVFTFIPDWLESRLLARAKKNGLRPFLVGRSERPETVTDMWRRKINKAFELAGRFDEPPTPHRFRQTFARILLERGVPVADVADLPGDDEKTVREHYSRWVRNAKRGLQKSSEMHLPTNRSPDLSRCLAHAANGSYRDHWQALQAQESS